MDMEVDTYLKYMEDHVEIYKEYGCTLICNCWMSTNKHHIINFMIYYITGTIF